MYKIQVYYDKDCRREAINIAAFRLGISPPIIEEVWKDRQYILKGWHHFPLMLLQAVEVADSVDDLTEEEQEYYQTQSVFSEVFDGSELWFPLGWDPALVAGIKMSNIYVISNCDSILETYFYC